MSVPDHLRADPRWQDATRLGAHTGDALTFMRPRRSPRRFLRYPLAIAVGFIVVFGCRVCGMTNIGPLAFGVAAGLGVWASEGWGR